MSFKHILTASTFMILSMVFLNYINHSKDIHLNKSFSTFPKQIGEWAGKEERLDEKIYDILGADEFYFSNYRRPDGCQVQFYIGFYQSQREGDLIHSPKNCMPGSGWNIIKTHVEELIIPNTNPGKIKTIKLVIQKDAQKQVVLYFFKSRGRIIYSEYMQKIYLVIDSIVRHRTDGSFVRLITPVSNDDEDKALNTLKDFAVQLMPILNEYIPS
jgi:EpsI family protein